MFARAVNLLVSELRAYIASTKPVIVPTDMDDPAYVVAGNIALADSQVGNSPIPPIQQRVVVSVINIAEEAAFKNAPHFERNGSKTRYRNAPSFLNLYLLFSANYEKYELALRRLAQVVTFFQGRNTFSLREAQGLKDTDEAAMELRLVVELMSLSFEQVNYLWASLGGKQMPFVLYKVRLVRIQADFQQAESPVIESVAADESSV